MQSRTLRCQSACVLLLLLGCLGAQADDDYYYARDPNTELAIEAAGGSDHFGYNLRLYGGPESGYVVNISGDLTPRGKGVFVDEQEGQDRQTRITLQKAPDGKAWRVHATGLTFQDGPQAGKPAEVDGTYQPISHAERVARAKRRWQAADALLNARYQALRTELAPESFAELRRLQREWVERRDYMATWRPSAMPEGEFPLEESADYWDGIQEETQTRLEFLHAWAGKGIEPGLTGTYKDFMGGTLALKQTDKGLEFQLEVVRGHNSSTGDISGVARLEGQRAVFSDDDPSPARLTFSFAEGRRVTVEEENTSRYGGRGAYFAGVYCKVNSTPDFEGSSD